MPNTPRGNRPNESVDKNKQSTLSTNSQDLKQAQSNTQNKASNILNNQTNPKEEQEKKDALNRLNDITVKNRREYLALFNIFAQDIGKLPDVVKSNFENCEFQDTKKLLEARFNGLKKTIISKKSEETEHIISDIIKLFEIINKLISINTVTIKDTQAFEDFQTYIDNYCSDLIRLLISHKISRPFAGSIIMLQGRFLSNYSHLVDIPSYADEHKLDTIRKTALFRIQRGETLKKNVDFLGSETQKNMAETVTKGNSLKLNLRFSYEYEKRGIQKEGLETRRAYIKTFIDLYNSLNNPASPPENERELIEDFITNFDEHSRIAFDIDIIDNLIEYGENIDRQLLTALLEILVGEIDAHSHGNYKIGQYRIRLVRKLNNMIEQLEEKAETLEKLNLTDVLTGAYNRRHFDESFNNAINQSSRNGKSFSLLMFDLDHFKKFNDILGHAVGDLVLKQVSEKVKSLIRSHDLFFRYGGEEFCLILPDTSTEGAMILAEKLRNEIAKIEITSDGGEKIAWPKGEKKGQIVQPTISMGVTTWRKDSSTESLFEEADKALYEAKNSGRNRVMKAAIKEKSK